jgi:hypothetical protein
MGHLLQPITYTLSSITSMNGNILDAVNNSRGMISYLRDSITNVIQTVFGAFVNLILDFQKIMIAIIDMFGKVTGIITTILYIIDTLYRTAVSA